ncbi:MAG: LPS-assembly protein LptD, partial [Candidatus Dadabacteria bacterium]
VIYLSCSAYAQSNKKRYLFSEDTKEFREKQKKEIEETLRRLKPKSKEAKINASSLRYDDKEKVLYGSGNMVLSKEGYQIEGEEGWYNTETHNLFLKGDVVITTPEGLLQCDEVRFNLDSEKGKFVNIKGDITKAGYIVSAKEGEKIDEKIFKFKEAELTTCHCPDGSRPWLVRCNNAVLDVEKKVTAKNAVLSLFGLPLFYTPYISLPTGRARESGFLAPQLGFNNKDGLKLRVPYFWVTDDFSDILFEPFVETSTRAGLFLQGRKAFNSKHYFTVKGLYSNESLRDNSLKGTDVAGLDDPTFDENRLGLYYKHVFSGKEGFFKKIQAAANIHYTGDDLLLREIDFPELGDRRDRFTTSRVLFRSLLTDKIWAEALAEFNQDLIGNDDNVVQRLPELRILGGDSWRPFGFNPYGFKTVGTFALTATDFVRKKNTDGWRLDIHPALKMPFHYKNYFNSNLRVDLRYTRYYLRDNFDTTRSLKLDKNSDRLIGTFSYDMSTSLEKVYSVSPSSFLATVTSLGRENEKLRIQRIKHTIEPFWRFTFIPSVSQDGNPTFDALDRIRERSLFTYGIVSRIYGSFRQSKFAKEKVPQVLPRIEDIPLLSESISKSFTSWQDVLKEAQGYGGKRRKNQVREIARFQITQSYDYKEDIKDKDPGRDAFSDIELGIFLNPVNLIQFNSVIGYNPNDSDFETFRFETLLLDDRDDKLNFRYNFIKDALSQFEGSAELALTGQLKLGFYSRFDAREGEFIENQGALRVVSSCRCWYADFGIKDRSNPDRTDFLFNLTLKGLGALEQKFGF